MDFEYIHRIQNRLDELSQSKLDSLFNIKDIGDFREAIGFLRAIRKFVEIMKDENNPKPKEKNNGEPTQYAARDRSETGYSI